MKFEAGEIEGAYVVHLEERSDDRGFFARTFCVDEFSALGLDPKVVQCNLSYNYRRGTLRGMHWQASPHEETKYIRCIRGRIYDVLIDIRPASTTYLRWIGVELSAENRLAVYAPKGTAHGYLTLEDRCEVLYQVSQVFTPEADRGARWNDPSFGIVWPFEPTLVSDKDSGHPDFQPG
jgi:dTDP-4-dehydrorhamnose 3,5-epimerase